MLDLNQTISITLTANIINTPIKMQKLSDGIFKKTQVCAVCRKQKNKQKNPITLNTKTQVIKIWKNRCTK